MEYSPQFPLIYARLIKNEKRKEKGLNMERKTYGTPELKIINLIGSDIITASVTDVDVEGNIPKDESTWQDNW